MQEQQWTIRRILDWTTDFFTQKGISTPRLDSEILLAHSLSVDRLHLYLNMDRPLVPKERAHYRELITRRSQREPIAYITGQKEFWSIAFDIQPGILIPRPETEILVEVVLNKIKNLNKPSVLEIGTGSGAVSIALAKERPDAVISATDVNPDALKIAAGNAVKSQVSESIKFMQSDLFGSVDAETQFDLVCSNPPYIPSVDRESLQPEIKDYEPWIALDGGPNGLSIIRELIETARLYIREGGFLVMEFGDGQDASVKTLLEQTGSFSEIEVHPDLAGMPRVICARVIP